MNAHVSRCISLVGLALLSASALAGTEQSPVRVLSFEERDQDNHKRDLGDEQTTVDINSRLTVHIDKAVLRGATPSSAENAAVTAALQRANALSKAAVAGQAALKQLAPALAAWAQRTEKQQRLVEQLRDALKPAADAALQVIAQAPRGSPLRDKLNEALARGGSQLDQFRAVFAAAESEAAALRQQSGSLQQEARDYYVLGAWMATAAGTNPVHIDGFDTYPVGDRVEVERWVITLTDAQKEELKQLATTAKALNDQGAEILTQLATAAGQTLRTLIEKELPCIATVNDKITALEQTTSSAVKQQEADLERYRTALEGYRALLTGLKSKYESQAASKTSSADFLIGTNADLVGLVEQTKSLVETLKTLQTLPQKIKDAAAQVQSALKDLTTSADSCVRDAASFVASLSDLRTSIDAALSGRKVDASLLEFGKEVSRLDLDSLPGEATFSLINSGRRAAGDTLVIKLGTGHDDSKPKDLESREFQVLRLVPHIDTVVGLIFAHPSGASDLKAHFQAAPSYSVLYKFRCESPTCRKLWDIGVGINVSALDFNHDDTPELGVGLVGSVVRDFVQVGVGLNVPRKQWYGFFGLRLPLPTFTLPTAGSSAAGQ